MNAYLDAYYDRGGRKLDTARAYAPMAPDSSEARLGEVKAGERFEIDTKVVSFVSGSHEKAKIHESVNASLGALHLPQVDIEYLHALDRTVTFYETCQAMDEAYRAGKFKRFGLSNYSAEVCTASSYSSFPT